MTLRFYDFKCPICGHTKAALENIGTGSVIADCPGKEQGSVACMLFRVTTNIPRHVKIDIEAPAFVPSHVKRARNLGHGGANAKTEGQYDNDPIEGYKSKIMVGPTKR